MMASKTKKNASKLAKKKILGYIISIIVILVGGYFAKDYIIDNPYEDTPLSEYYLPVEGLEGKELMDALHDIISTNIVGVNYGDARVALAEADVDPNDDTKVLTIYSRESVNKTWDGGDTWAREHVWPNSRLGIERVENHKINQASDLHNLRAIVPRVNSSRSNKVFGPETTSDTYFPGDEDKGDVARILFYMVIRYPELKLVEEVLDNDPETNYTPDGAKMAILSYLITWHYEDPVDDFERNRNEVIYSYQKNRNPFIDHPEFVAKIFEHDDYKNLSSDIEDNNYHHIYYFDERRRLDLWV